MKNLFILLFLLIGSSLVAQDGKRIEVLFLGDDGHHKPIERVPTLMAALGPKGINFTYTDDMADLNAETLNKYDALMLYANIDEINPQAEKALLDFVASGKGFLPIHCASYCFRNSEEFVKLVGGQFWRHTMDSISTESLQPEHPIMKGLSPFTAYDETYLHSHLQADNNVLAEREIKEDQKTDKPDAKTEPYTWTRTHGKGKVFYTAYGHDERTWEKQGFQDLIYNAILWSINEEARSAFDARNPKPFEYKLAALPNYERRSEEQVQQLPLIPEESMKHIQVPVDFNLELFAAEPNVMHPIAITWDEKGRLFVLITKDYPNERKPEGGGDYILMCEDTDGDGKADKFTRFAEGLSIPTGMVFANGGLVVTQAPDILFFEDTDGDDKADVKKTLYSGFGTFDTHAGPSNLKYGFDNWIWGCVGYSGYKAKIGDADTLEFGQAFFRFKADGSKMEWMTSTSNNTWGFAFNETNDVFGSTANNAHGWYMAIPHSFYNSANRTDNGSKGTDTHKGMTPITEKVRQVDVFQGFTAAAGHNFYTARSFPKNYWNKIAFVSEPTGHVLHQNNMVKNGTDYSDKEAFNLMAGADEWFSPVFAEVGPDGAVWVADWYSFIIQHNPQPSGFAMGTGNAYETDLRDYTHGRIYRVSYKEAPEYTALSLSKNDPEGLLHALQNDNMFWRMQGQRLLVDRGEKDVVPSLIEILKNPGLDEIGINAPAIHALWTLDGLGATDQSIIEIGLSHPSADVRKNTLKVMDFNAASVDLILKHDLLDDEEALVVMNSLLVFSKSPLNAEAEAAFFEKLNNSNDIQDRWLPDAFACVLTANEGRLMKIHLANQKASEESIIPEMDHSVHQMTEQNGAEAALSEGIDLIIVDIKMSPANPTVGERVLVTVDIKNQGKADLPTDVLIPFQVDLVGMGILNTVMSRNFKDGIKSGETVSISRSINGPWSGNLSFRADIAGDYQVNVSLDKNNEIQESNKANNLKSANLIFAGPLKMSSHSLERAIRSYASVASADDLSELMKNWQHLGVQEQNAFYKAVSEGWNYRQKDVSVSASNEAFLKTLDTNGNDKLERILKAWNVYEESEADQNVKIITIKAIREAMKYDLSEFTVKAGETVEIVFENPDAMQHNIVIIQPGTMEKVGLAADKLITASNGAELNYVPEVPEVLFASSLVNPDQTYRLRFKVPETAGDYPFICTFPGHWRLMNGIMKVVE